ncbi:hypothetical protein MTR67_012722 [Solanum verrucosum]|uniref:Uncharacterized protein n=1 Tax=Solanum verrucosum TaxID=315347 RepID=A0AAF0QAC2_SOLVR|nr:hypothetical protein MTR67_012722 [Solanum verrucosum]
MELSIASHGKASPFADLTKENKEFKKDVLMILDELIPKKAIDLPESKRLEEINENEDSPTDSAELKIENRSKRDLDAENLNLHHEKIPTDRGSNDGPCWSTVVHVRGWWRTTDHQHGPWSDLRSVDGDRDIQSNIDNEKPMFRYIPCERQKKGQPLPKECTQQVHPPRKELCHTTFQDLKEKMIVPVAQVPSIPLDPSKGNTQFGELRDEVIDEKIDGLTKSQMWLRKKGYYVATPRRLTPRVSAFERLGPKDEEESSEQVHGDATTSKTSVFHRLGAKRKSLSGKTLLEHENQDFCDVTNNKEIHSVFLSRMKRKTILSITTDGSLEVKRSTVVFTDQFHEKTKKDKEEAIIVFVENQREDSNFIQSSYHITVEEGPHIDDTNDDVQEAPPQLEDDVQASIDDLKEINLGTLEDPRTTFISALLTPQEERKYFK